MAAYFPKLHGRNTHFAEVKEFFGNFTRGEAAIPDATRFVFLCYTNRSGSTFLAEALSASRHLNNAQEYLNSAAIIRHAKSEGFRSFHEYFSWRVSHSGRGNILVCKLAIGHLDLLGRSGVLDQIIDVSQFVFLERADKLAQAISFEIAHQTGMWKSTLEQQVSPQGPEFSARRLTDVMAWIAEHNRMFEVFFGRNGIVPTCVVYEQLISAPNDCLEYIGRQIRVENLRFQRENLKLRPQSGQLNAEWRSRYMAEPSKHGSLMPRLRRAVREAVLPS